MDEEDILWVRGGCKGLSFDEIGKALSRDHSTVHYAYNKVQKDIENDKNFASVIEVLKKKINIE